MFLISNSPRGHATYYVTIPDTITTVVMQAVAINNKTGLGLATPLRIVSKKDYFVSLKMPYSVRRGQQVSLLATAFNNHQEEIRVSLKKERFKIANSMILAGKQRKMLIAFENYKVKYST